MLTIIQVTTGAEIATVRDLFLEYQQLLGIDLCFQGFEAEVSSLPGAYAPPGGRLLLALLDDVPAGCVALRALDPPRCEMKRLFVRPSARGRGIGVALVSRVLDEARALEYLEIVLDTIPSMTEAQQVYERFGFRDIPAYRVNPIAGTRYLAKVLAEP